MHNVVRSPGYNVFDGHRAQQQAVQASDLERHQHAQHAHGALRAQAVGGAQVLARGPQQLAHASEVHAAW